MTGECSSNPEKGGSVTMGGSRKGPLGPHPLPFLGHPLLTTVWTGVESLALSGKCLSLAALHPCWRRIGGGRNLFPTLGSCPCPPTPARPPPPPWAAPTAPHLRSLVVSSAEEASFRCKVHLQDLQTVFSLGCKSSALGIVNRLECRVNVCLEKTPS